MGTVPLLATAHRDFQALCAATMTRRCKHPGTVTAVASHQYANDVGVASLLHQVVPPLQRAPQVWWHAVLPGQWAGTVYCRAPLAC